MPEPPAGEFVMRGQTATLTLECVPQEACAGHFEQYPAMPVAVLMGQLGLVAAAHFAAPYRVASATMSAQDFCWAGERARFVSPLAVFLFSVFLMFAVMGFLGSPANMLDADSEAGREFRREAGEIDAQLVELRARRAAAASVNERSCGRPAKTMAVARVCVCACVCGAKRGGESGPAKSII